MKPAYYKHVNCKDMFIEVLTSQELISGNFYIVYICWITGAMGDPWLATEKTFNNVVLKRDLHNWIKIGELC